MFVLGHYLFLEAHSFPLASLSENCSLLGTDNVRGQISVHIFAPNGDYCLFIPQDLAFEELKQGLYPFLDQKFKDFSRTFKDTFPIFQGLHAVQYQAVVFVFIFFLLFCVATFLPVTFIFELST